MEQNELKKLSLQARLVLKQEYDLDKITQTILAIPGLIGDINLQRSECPPWASGLLSYSLVQFNFFIARCDIDRGDTRSEINVVSNENGKTNTFHLKLNNFVSTSSVHAIEITNLKKLFELIKTNLNSKIFDGTHYMWEDY